MNMVFDMKSLISHIQFFVNLKKRVKIGGYIAHGKNSYIGFHKDQF